MKTHDLIQGSPDWLAYRANHFNASDAPAMLGCSPYKTRSELLHELATGQAPDVDPATQRRFDDGHQFEALARPVAAEIMGEALYPVVGSDGELSASFDGLTMAETRSAEHKSLNDEIRAALPHQGRDSHLYNDATKLGKVYRVQMEQQLMVSKAEENLFSATKWEGDKLVEERHAWYRSDPALRAEILAGWAQFKQDLAAYVPPEVIVAPVAEPQMGLPAVVIKVEGSIALVDNLPAIGVALNAYIAGINKKPESDQDFANLEATVKHLKAFEEALGASEENALAQVGSVDAMRKTVALYRELASSNRLLVDKLVKAEKENRRTAIVGDAAAELVTHVKKLNDRLGKPYMPTITADFQGVIKGLKSIDSMRDKVATELARCKIAANEAADRIQANMQKLVAVGDKVSFSDAAALVLKAPDDLAAVIALRVAEADRKAEELRESIRKEEADKLAAAPVDIAQAATENVAPTVTHGDVVRVMMPATVRQAMAPKPAAKPETPPTLTLGEISTRLGFNCTSTFLATLGFEATTVKVAKLYHSDDFTPICEAIKTHISEVQDQFEPVAA
jgi:putative phage-type endonuclease